MKPVKTAASFAAAFSCALLAQAQPSHICANAYRAGEPDVLAVPSTGPSDPSMPGPPQAFVSAYAKAGRPTLAVLWNREFSDRLEQSVASQVRVDSLYSSNGEAVALGMSQRGTTANTTVTVAQAKTTQPLRDGPAQGLDLQMRAVFLQTLASAGVRLLDRSLLMRTTAARKKGQAAQLDSQQIETGALAGHASLLLEVLSTRDTTASLGWSVHLSIKRLADGAVLAEAYIDGALPPDAARATPRFDADPRGGFRELVQLTTAADMGRRLGVQTLTQLSAALAR